NTFINVGTFQKTGGTGTTSIGWNFNSTGTINTSTGSLYCSTWTGANTLNGLANMTFDLHNASLTVLSNAVMNWISGDLSAGSLTVAAGGTLTISNSVYLSSSAPGGALTNYGTVVWAAAGGNYLYGYGGAVIFNAGLWQATTDNNLYNASGTNTFINVGTFQKTGGTGATTIGWKFNTTGTISTLSGALSISDWIGNNVLYGSPTLSGGATLFGTLTVPSGEVLTAVR